MTLSDRVRRTRLPPPRHPAREVLLRRLADLAATAASARRQLFEHSGDLHGTPLQDCASEAGRLLAKMEHLHEAVALLILEGTP